MPDILPHQDGASPGKAEALLAGVLAAAAALAEGLDRLVWGAAYNGDQATLRYLLANGGGASWTPSMMDDEVYEGDSCLRVASMSGYEGAVKELLESGVAVDEVPAYSGASTALCLAAEEGYGGVVEHLLKAGADVNKVNTYSGATPLCLAAAEGHGGVVEQLLKAGADVDKAPTDSGATPLYLAAEAGHEAIAEQLLKAGADVDKATTDSGSAPLHIAAVMGHGGVVEQLLKVGADVNKVDTRGGATPLHDAARRGREGVVKQLLKAGADLKTEPSPLTAAAYNGNSRVCSLLLEGGANVNHMSGDEGTALGNAVTRGHRDAALVLMEHGASSSDETLTNPMLKDLNKWMAEALQENKRAMAEKDRRMEEMVQGIPEWCAQAASAVMADEGKNDGSSSSRSAPAEVKHGGVERKSTVPSTEE